MNGRSRSEDVRPGRSRKSLMRVTVHMHGFPSASNQRERQVSHRFFSQLRLLMAPSLCRPVTAEPLTIKPATRIRVTASLGAITAITEDQLMSPKVLSAVSAAILLSLVSLDSASAAGGCGPGFHPGPYGRCRPNERPVVIVPGAPVVVAPAPVVCTGGFRWHPRFRRCVVL